MNMFDWTKAYFQTESPGLADTRATMATLASYANFTDRTCYPSQRTLARLLGCSTETIRRHVRKNIDAGWIAKIRDGKSNSVTNKYEFVVPTPLTHEGSAHHKLPTSTRGVEDSPRPRGVAPLTHEGSTPLTSVGLTTKRTTQGTTQVPCSTDPVGGSGDIFSSQPDRRSTTEDTPLTHEGSTPHMGKGGLTPEEIAEIQAKHRGEVWPSASPEDRPKRQPWEEAPWFDLPDAKPESAAPKPLWVGADPFAD